MKTNTTSIIGLACDTGSVRFAVVGYQYPEASPATIDADWLQFEVQVSSCDGSWTRTDPTELASRIIDLPDWFEEITQGTADLPTVYRFTEPTLVLEVDEGTSGALTLRVTLAYELVDRDVVDDDETTLDFSVTADDLHQIAGRVREALSAYPPRRIEEDLHFAHKHVKQTGYWLHGVTLYPIAETHAAAIIREPELFGLTEAEVQDAYHRHGEHLGVEGRAREELIRRVAQHGWVRIRHYNTPRDYWSIQCSDVAEHRREIALFVRLGVDVGFIRSDDELRIVGFDDDAERTYRFQDGGASRFIAED